MTPDDPAHQPIYEQMKQYGTLEALGEFLSPFLLPRTLRIRLAECDGEAEAYYDNASVTLCYELIADLWENMPEETTPGGIEPIDTVIGPLYEISLHEAAHALFDLLDLPILGREEDAGDCRPLEDYSGDHSTPGQRAFNLLCIAYGADKKLFSDFVSKGYLPKERAKWCFEEYEQVEDAFDLLIRPQALAERLHNRPWLCDRLADSAELKPGDCLLPPAE